MSLLNKTNNNYDNNKLLYVPEIQWLIFSLFAYYVPEIDLLF